MEIRRGMRRTHSIEVPPERDQPYEIPWREVEHQQVDDLELDGFDYIGHIGTVKDREYWGSQEEWDEEIAKLDKIEKRVKEIGGFGFRIERANG